MIEVWCDGSSNGRSGAPTGWGYIIIKNDTILYCNCGAEDAGSNQTAELTAAIEGLKALDLVKMDILESGEKVVLVSDSMYALNNAMGKYNPVKNLELVFQLQELYNRLGTATRWVKGHNGNKINELCDKLAKKGRSMGNLKKGDLK